MQKVLHTKAEILHKSVHENEGILDAVVGSTDVLDRAGDSIRQDGWEFATFKNTNPVILWGHNVKEERPPIGKALKVWVAGKGTKKARLMFQVKFDLQDNFAAEIFRKVKDGFLNTVSVGFKPIEWEDIDANNVFGGRKFLKQELLELSFVPVPANPQAIVALKGMNDKRVVPIKIEDMYADKDESEKKTLHGGGDKPKKPKKPRKNKKPNNNKEKVENEIDDTGKKPEKKGQDHIGDATKKITKKKVVKKEIKKVKKVAKVVSKSVIRFKDLGTLPQSASWDAAGEVKKADTKALKLMSTWYDKSDPNVKSSYKLPHHAGDMGHKAVWRGIAAAMGALLGARGGVDIPTDDRKGVYNHLKKHYKQFDKPIPEFKAVENQVLAGFDEEIHALMLDREDRYAVRLIKKSIRETKKTRKIEKAPKVDSKYTDKELSMALKVIDLALSQHLNGSAKGGDKTKG